MTGQQLEREHAVDVQQAASISIRARLERELDALDVALKNARTVVHEIDPDCSLPEGPAPPRREPRKAHTWKWWS